MVHPFGSCAKPIWCASVLLKCKQRLIQEEADFFFPFCVLIQSLKWIFFFQEEEKNERKKKKICPLLCIVVLVFTFPGKSGTASTLLPVPSLSGRQATGFRLEGGGRVSPFPFEFFYFSSTVDISSRIFSSESERSDSLSRYSMS